MPSSEDIFWRITLLIVPKDCYRASNLNTSGHLYIETKVAEKDISGNHHLIWKIIYHLKISSYSAPGKELEKKPHH